MSEAPNPIELVGYLEEALPVEEMSRIEEKLRTDSAWRQAILDLCGEIDSGEHSVATIWRRHRLTCPPREQLGAYSVGGLPPEEEDYVRFHLEVCKCPWCQANLDDVKAQVEAGSAATSRRRKFFETSVGQLPKSLT